MTKLHVLLPGSSMVERSAVNRNVAGSSPARGANLNPTPSYHCAAVSTPSFVSSGCPSCPDGESRVVNAKPSPVLSDTSLRHFRSSFKCSAYLSVTSKYSAKADISRSQVIVSVTLSTTPRITLQCLFRWTPDDSPVGVMFSARFGEDATLFRLAAQLEKAQRGRRNGSRSGLQHRLNLG